VGAAVVGASAVSLPPHAAPMSANELMRAARGSRVTVCSGV
jgi:hypothetical protein